LRGKTTLGAPRKVFEYRKGVESEKRGRVAASRVAGGKVTISNSTEPSWDKKPGPLPTWGPYS